MAEASVMSVARRRRLAISALMAVAILHSLLWALILPPWQGADENLRYAALQAVAHDRWGTKLISANALVDLLQAPDPSSAQSISTVSSDIIYDKTLLYHPVQGAMPWIVPDYREHFSLSYELMAPVYALLAASIGSWMPYLVRFICSLFSALVVYATYRTALTVWPNRSVLALAAGAVPALLPAAAAAHATVLPDAVGNALAAGALALLVAVVVKGATPARIATALGLVVAAVLTKQTTLYLVPLGVGAVPIAWAVARPGRLKAGRRVALGIGLALIVGALVLAAMSAREVGERSFGQIALMRFIDPTAWVRAFSPLLDVIRPPLIVRSFWGGIGWFQGFFPPLVETALAILGVGVWIAALFALADPRTRERAGIDRRRLAGISLLLLAAVAVMGQALMRDVLSQDIGIVRNAAQGRWLFAALPAFAIVGVLGFGAWQPPRRDLATATVCAVGLAVLSGALAFGVAVPYFYVVFPDLVREHRLFFGRLVPVRPGVMRLSATRPTLIGRPATMGVAVAVWLAAIVGYTATAYDLAAQEGAAESGDERVPRVGARRVRRRRADLDET